MSEPSAMPLVCVEFYGSLDQDELLAAVDVPVGKERSFAIQIGRLLCKMRNRSSVNASLLDADGNVLERMIVVR